MSRLRKESHVACLLTILHSGLLSRLERRSRAKDCAALRFSGGSGMRGPAGSPSRRRWLRRIELAGGTIESPSGMPSVRMLPVLRLCEPRQQMIPLAWERVMNVPEV